MAIISRSGDSRPAVDHATAVDAAANDGCSDTPVRAIGSGARGGSGGAGLCEGGDVDANAILGVSVWNQLDLPYAGRLLHDGSRMVPVVEYALHCSGMGIL